MGHEALQPFEGFGYVEPTADQPPAVIDGIETLVVPSARLEAPFSSAETNPSPIGESSGNQSLLSDPVNGETVPTQVNGGGGETTPRALGNLGLSDPGGGETVPRLLNGSLEGGDMRAILGNSGSGYGGSETGGNYGGDTSDHHMYPTSPGGTTSD